MKIYAVGLPHVESIERCHANTVAALGTPHAWLHRHPEHDAWFYVLTGGRPGGGDGAPIGDVEELADVLTRILTLAQDDGVPLTVRLTAGRRLVVPAAHWPVFQISDRL